jgi:probable HAF family extracellular repeat protein
VAGYADITAAISHATLWSGGAAVDLTPSAPYGSGAFGINNAGIAVGSINSNYGVDKRATQWADGGTTDLGTLGGSIGYAVAINDSGLVVGASQGETFNIHATRWDAGVPSNIGSDESFIGVVRDVNNAGLLVGWVDRQAIGYDRAATWLDNVETLLPITGRYSVAYGVNDAGQIVGQMDGSAALWEGGQVYPLTSLLDPNLIAAGWVLRSAYGINNQGWIVGEAVNGRLEVHAYVLAPIPEPTTVVLLLCGLALIAVRSRSVAVPLTSRRRAARVPAC